MKKHLLIGGAAAAFLARHRLRLIALAVADDWAMITQIRADALAYVAYLET